MNKAGSAAKVKLNSFDDLFGAEQPQVGTEQVQEIALSELYEFDGHPFKVLDDEKMQETVESVREHGILMPGIARPRAEGGYEIIAGHRRRHACELVGLETMPMFIRNYTDDEATIIMVDSNIQREDILPSEKAKAYRMKYEAMKHQGSRAGGLTLDELGEAAGESAKTVQRYIWISRLSEPLLDMVDAGKIGIMQAVDLSFLSEDAQQWVLVAIQDINAVITKQQSAMLKESDKKGELTFPMVRMLLEKEKPVERKLDEYEIDVELVDVVVSGSRCRGLEKAGSDLDVVVEYKGREHEDDLFNVFNEDGLMIGGVKVDINPITEGKTGTLATYLPEVESYLAEKQAMQKASAVEAIPEKTITLTVAECGEFHSLGEFHENIASVEEAIAVWKSIPPERMNGIPSIGINIHTEGTERYEDVEMDILSGKVIDLEVLDYVPDITDEPKAIEVIAELIDKLPDIEVRGSLEKWQAAILASQIDQFSYDYDTYQYQDTVEDREAQVANITEDIRNGNTGYLNDFLNAVISEGVREGITDIFGEGVEIDDSEAVQTARRAKELLDKLAEYKPLAKIEELEEQNYNMIDNVLNNGAEKKEQEQTKGRISIKEKLAEKKAVIEQRDRAEHTSPEKETEKKSQREM